MCNEIRQRHNFFGESAPPLRSIYLGGGTPSILPEAELAQLFEAVYATFSVDSDAEITLEANPDDLSPEKTQFLATQTPVNRLSVGVQSFQDEVLRWMNRAHDSHEAHRVLEGLAQRDFALNLDLIYALPEPYDRFWRSDAETMLGFTPEHISAYTLTIEEKTAFGHWAKKDRLRPLDDEKAAAQFLELSDRLTAAGYEQYEISNFARNQHYARHNTAYWLGEPYLGIGPGAHFFKDDTRWANPANNHRYVQAIRQGKLPALTETLSRTDQINEFMLTRLRTKWGADLQTLRDRYQFEAKAVFGEAIQDFQERGWLEQHGETLRLTRSGRLMADEIAAAFFL